MVNQQESKGEHIPLGGGFGARSSKTTKERPNPKLNSQGQNRAQKFLKEKEALTVAVREKKTTDPFFVADKTAKVSEHVLSQIRTLKPFIQEKAGLEKETINDLVEVMIDYYLENELDEEERAGFDMVYDYTTKAKRK